MCSYTRSWQCIIMWSYTRSWQCIIMCSYTRSWRCIIMCSYPRSWAHITSRLAPQSHRCTIRMYEPIYTVHTLFNNIPSLLFLIMIFWRIWSLRFRFSEKNARFGRRREAVEKGTREVRQNRKVAQLTSCLTSAEQLTKSILQ